MYNSVTFIYKFTKWCGHHHDPALGLLRRPKDIPPGPLQSLLAPTPSPGQPLRCFATVQICLFWMILMNGIIQCVFFFFYIRLLSLSMMCPRCMRVVCICICSFLIAGQYFVYGWTSVLIHSLVNGLLGCFHFLSTTNTIMNVCIHFNLLGLRGNCQTVFQIGPCTISQSPMTVYEGSSFFTSSPTLVICSFDCRHSSGCEVGSGGFDLHLPSG